MKFFIFIFGGIGIALLIGAAFAYNYSKKFIATAQKAQAVVTDLRYNRSSKGGGTYYPTVQFTANDGKTYTAYSNSGSNPSAYEVGENVEIYYNPDNPMDILLPDFFSLWGVPLILGGIGLVFTLIGGAIVFGKSGSPLRRSQKVW
ncbi:MAG: DUF3592 domain-containing protein [Cytophagales bacterium]|jgi:hypothetical protein|nr:DUF3592 domain-containing protein [Cytophagales bacterium]